MAMASYMSNSALNDAANDATSGTISIRLHDGAPGNSGTSNRIGSIEEDVAAAGWTAAASGVSETTADTNFGVLDASNSVDVEAYSLWDGSTFKGWADVFQPGTTTVGVTVAAGRTFTLSAGTVQFEFARP